MKYLLDTHILIWYTEEIQKLSSTARSLIDNTQNEIFVSIGSIFEMAIKIHIEKLHISKSISSFCDEIIDLGFQILPITIPIVSEYSNLPTFPDHKDPLR